MAKVAVRCPHCAKRYALAEESLGKTMKCPACQQAFTAETDNAAPPAAPPRQVQKPAVPKPTSAGVGSLLDDEDLFSAAATAPARARPKPSSGEAGGKAKGKKGGKSPEAGIRIYQENGQWHADIPQSLINKHYGTWLVWGAVAYLLLSIGFGFAKMPLLGGWGLTAALIAGTAGWWKLNDQYFKKWTDFGERQLLMREAPEPRWLSANLYAVILLGFVSMAIWGGRTFGKPGSRLGPPLAAPQQPTPGGQPAPQPGPQPPVPAPAGQPPVGQPPAAQAAPEPDPELKAIFADVASPDPAKLREALPKLLARNVDEAQRPALLRHLEPHLRSFWLSEDGSDPTKASLPDLLAVMERHRTEGTGAAISRAMMIGANDTSRKLMMKSVRRLKDPESAFHLAIGYHGDDPEVLEFIRELGPSAEIAWMTFIVRPDPALRAEAGKMLKQFGTAKVIQALEKEVLAHPDNADARAAYEAIKARK